VVLSTYKESTDIDLNILYELSKWTIESRYN
jgi:hypothetical protein